MTWTSPLSLNNLLAGKEKGEDRNTKIWISLEQSGPLKQNKKHFS